MEENTNTDSLKQDKSKMAKHGASAGGGMVYLLGGYWSCGVLHSAGWRLWPGSYWRAQSPYLAGAADVSCAEVFADVRQRVDTQGPNRF